ncbi:DNA repair protein RecO [Prosthecomicrobium sp. N25]|uniref:DNA repair protein RecO n=1 Tax=Prosthecomicrobium sp. N25 TaxID=3129254 RepID=UPI003078606E
MEWTDDAIVLSTRRHGEANAVLEAMTRSHGRHLGLVRGGRSRKLAASLQPGNVVSLTWRARLDEHLGYFTVEPLRHRAAVLMTSAVGLHAVQTLAAHLRLLPERDPHPALHDAVDEVLDRLQDPAEAGALMVVFELQLLDELGVGLDLGACALTGARDDLAWVSPKTGRAAAREAGAPYADRLIPLPPYLAARPGTNYPPPSAADLEAGFRLAGHFLESRVWHARGLDPPLSRDMLIRAIRTAAGGEES